MRTLLSLIALAIGASAALATPGADAALAVGERRAVLVNAVDECYAIPEGSIDVSRLGSRTVVVTGRRPGAAELHVVAGGREWAMPITVSGAPEPVAPLAVEPPAVALLEEAGVTRSAPVLDERVPQPITPVPPAAAPEEATEAGTEPGPVAAPEIRSAERAAVRRAAYAAAELAERDFLPRAPSDAASVTPASDPDRAPVTSALPVASFRAPPRRLAIDDTLHAAPAVRERSGRTLPRLTGILRTAHGPIALLDGTPVGVGERHGEFTVERVDDDRAVLEQDGATVTLKLSGR